eukprot:COSAG03_NODE_387_length_8309_cov_2.520828_5_plen_115_part_00
MWGTRPEERGRRLLPSLAARAAAWGGGFVRGAAVRVARADHSDHSGCSRRLRFFGQTGHGTASAFHDAHVAALGDRRLVQLGPSAAAAAAASSRPRPVGNLGHGEDRAQNGLGD